MARHIGRYEILGEIGRGGFGHVYRGIDPTMGRSVAIKTLASDGDAGLLTRFRNEATASGRLRHPNIVTIHDFGEHEGVPFIVMELLEGQDLQQLMASGAPVSLLTKVRIMTQVAAGLQHAHNHGIIHRDVKPANIMVLPDGSVKIMDFGIALITQATNSRLTPRGAMIGTFFYMAPEQFRNAQPDSRSDIFAYGLIFYELMSGVHPFHAVDAGALMYNILSVEPVPIGELVPDCPRELRAVIERLLNKDPESRYQNLDDVLFDIEPALGELRKKRAHELFEEAEAAKSARRFDVAQELVRQILELTPGDERVRRLREGIQIELRRQAIRPKVDDLIRRGQEALAAGKPADAVLRFESAIRLADVPEVVPLLEEARAGVERSREASRLASEAEQTFKSGDPAGAAGLARQALELVPAEPVAARVLAEAEAVLAEERRRAELAQDLARAQRLIDIRSWDEAGVLIEKIDREFPGIPEVALLAKKRRAGWVKEERERLLAVGWSAARQQVQQGDLTSALATLEKLAAQYPESTDVETMLGFVRVELEAQTRRDHVSRSIADAKAASVRREFDQALKLLDAALSRYPGDPDLQRERRSIAAEQRETARRAAAEKAIAAATAFRAQGRFPEAVPPLDDFLAAHGQDTAVTKLRDAILKDQEAARRAAQLHDFVHRARDLIAKGRAEDATALLKAPPSHLKNHPEVTQLLGVAQLQLQEQAERKAALEKALTATVQLRQKEAFNEALQVLNGFQNRYGADARLDEARNELRQAEREKAARDLFNQATALLAVDPAGATSLFAAAPEYIRQQPEIQNLEQAALRAVERQKARKAAAERTISLAAGMRAQGRFSEALPPVDEFLAAYGADPAMVELRETIVTERDTGRHAAERGQFVQRAKDLLASGRTADAIAWLKTASPNLKDDPQVTSLLSAAEFELRQQMERAKAAKDLLARASAMLATDPAGAAELLGAAPDYLRRRPEIESLERAALQAVEEQRTREAALKQAITSATALLAQARFPEALRPLDDFLAVRGFDPTVAGLRETILKEQEAARRDAELRELLQPARDLIAQGRAQEATARLEAAAPELKNHPSVVQLLGAAHAEVQRLAERAKAGENLARRVADLLAVDPVAATALLAAAPDDLRRRPEIARLEQEALRAGAERRQREAAAGSAIASAAPYRSQGRFAEALRPLDDFLAAYGTDPAITDLREAILREQEAARRAAELNEFLKRAETLMAGDRIEEALALLQAPPPHLTNHRRIKELVGAAELKLRQRDERNAALDKALASARDLRHKESFDEAQQILDHFQESYGADAKIELARNQIRQAERDKAARNLLDQATAILATNPAGATALFSVAPEYLREYPEVKNLEQAALRAVEEQRAREAEATLVEEVRELCAARKFSAALRIIDGAKTQFPGRLAAMRQDVVAEQEKHERERLRKETIDNVHALLTEHRYEDATRALAALKPDPEDQDLMRLRADINARQALWAAEQEERNVRQGLTRAQDLLAKAPGEAVRLLEALKRDHPVRGDIATALHDAQEALRRQQRRDLLQEVERLCAQDQFESALARLDGAPPDEGDELILARQRVKSRQDEALHRRAVEAVQESLEIRKRDPKRALKGLQSLVDPLRSRPEVQAAEQECQEAITEAERTAAITAIEDLCARNKFRKAQARHQEAVARLGTNPQLDELRIEIEAGLQPKTQASPRPEEPSGTPRAPFLGKPIQAAGILGAVAVLSVGVWIYLRPPAAKPPTLRHVEVRTDPVGASVRLGDQSCQTPPCRFNLSPGTYQVHTQLDGYLPGEQTVTVGAEQRVYSFNLTLAPIVVPPRPGRPTGTLVVETKTPEALVFLDGSTIGRTDSRGRISSPVEAAAHKVRVEKTGYQTPPEQTVQIGANKSQSITFKLTPQNAKLELRGVPAGVQVRADGALVGQADGSGSFSTSIPAGPVTLRLTEGPASRDVPVVFEPGQTLSLEWASVAPPKVPVSSGPITPPKVDPAEQAWELIRTTSDPAQIQDYLDKYRTGSHTAEAQSRLETLIWGRTNPNDPQALRAYISQFPRGPHARDAQSRLAELAWDGVDKKDVQALRTFLEQYPDSAHKPEAQNQVDQMERQRLDQVEKQRQAAERLAATERAERAKQNAQQELLTKGIRSAIDQFNAAFEKKRPRDLRAVWPEAPKDYLESMTQPTATFSMTLIPSGNPTITGDTASLACELNSRATIRGTVTPRHRTVTVTLKNLGDRWVIASLGAVN